ncbi:hypothetical protein FRC04_009842 [Tulasnella sp. 424]|nr:hypothetical protein FRC04_009842 [Tulasnella sp. 424]KAG8972910.1 hypothetical protein FRC05_009464 [Tulasnella sp. 425]
MSAINPDEEVQPNTSRLPMDKHKEQRPKKEDPLGASADVELAILLPLDISLSEESFQHVDVEKLKIGDDTNQERVLRSVVRELSLLSSLSHENTVIFTGFVEDVSKGIAWLIFQWETNGNIREFLQSGTWEIPERISLIRDVACCIEYLHSHEPPICHGDLNRRITVKLNILVNSENRAVITDFGSARLLDRTTEGAASDAKIPTRSRAQNDGEKDSSPRIEMFITDTVTTFTGPAWTLRWAAPEVLDGEFPDLPSDIWAFGWICWEIMTDTYPFADVKQDGGVVLRVAAGDLPSVDYNERSSLSINVYLIQTRIIPSENNSGDSETNHSAALLRSIGRIHVQRGRMQAGMEQIRRSLDISRSTNNDEGAAGALSDLSEAYYRISDLPESEAAYKNAHAIYTKLGNQDGIALSLSGLARVYQRNGDHSKAISSLMEARDIYTPLDHDCGIANIHYDLGSAYIAEYEEAATALVEAHSIYLSLGVDLGIANAIAGLAYLRLVEKDHLKAASLYLEAQGILNG